MTDTTQDGAFQVGDLINNTYRIEAILGRGGTSEVYRARSEISGRVVAMKVLRSEFASNDEYLTLLTREEQIRDVSHAAVVRYSENNRTADGSVYLVMDYVEGPDLAEKMKDGGLSADALMEVARRVCEGLEAVHSQNIVHRDLSPDNIILRHGAPSEAVIIDFGIAKDTTPGAVTIVGNEFAGKYAYAAPEQLYGQSDHRSDIYSLGVVLLAVFRGETPNIGSNVKEMIDRKSAPLDTEGVPEPLRPLIDRMTEPDPARRFQSVGEVLDVIWGDEDRGRPSFVSYVPRPPPDAETAPEPAVKRRGGAMAALVGVVLLGAGGAGAYFSGALDAYLGPNYPLADPYTLTAAKTPDMGVRVRGFAPSPEAEDVIGAAVGRMDGAADLTLAEGDIPPGWSGGIAALLAILDPLSEFELDVTGAEAAVRGFAAAPEIRHDVARRLDEGMPPPLSGGAESLFGPRTLALDALRSLFKRLGDCGPLTLVDPPEAGYPIGARVTITGDVASAEKRAELYDQLARMSGNRVVVLDATVLNPALCRILQKLPDAPSGGIRFEFSYGDRPGLNPDGRYEPGDNPVIDLVLPSTLADGHLWVLITDVSGNVFNLFPTEGTGRIADLPVGADGTRRLRVAHPTAAVEEDDSLIGFFIDETFGKSKVSVLQAAEPSFPAMRPIAETVQSFTAALDTRLVGDGLVVERVDSRILESR